MDSNITPAADMFSLGMLIIALYNSPHKSPLDFNGSSSSYKRAFSSSSSVPSKTNNFMSSQPLPRDVVNGVLDRLITRRPAQRMDAREFQQAQYFDNILVSTIRFLDGLPGKTPNEKSQFMRGLPRILNQFPKSVLDKKILPALLEEMKDRELLTLILQNVFKIITMLPSGKRAFTEKVIPKLRETFLSAPAANPKAPTQERDSLKEAGLMVLLENMQIAADNSSGKEFKDDILPIINHALESPTHSLVDAALRTLPIVLPILDFSTVKNELFPVIASIFAKTSSMGIKIRGLEAFKTLCGGGNEQQDDFQGDGLTGVVAAPKAKSSNVSILDKYTIQEKIVPLLRAIKTKEPAVMVSRCKNTTQNNMLITLQMAALDVFKAISNQVDSDFLAMDVLPILWQFSLGPLLNLQQFQAYMNLIKTTSARVETEQTRKLQELGANGSAATTRNEFMSFGGPSTTNGFDTSNGNGDTDFEALVRGGQQGSSGGTDMLGRDPWANASASATSSTMLPSRPSTNRTRSDNASPAPTFSWSTPPVSPPPNTNLSAPKPQNRAITPDNTLNALNSSFPALSAANPGIGSSSFAQPQQQQIRPAMSMNSMTSPTSTTPSYTNTTQGSGINWSKASGSSTMSSANTWGNSMGSTNANMSTTNSSSSFPSIAPPPSQSRTQSPYSSFSIAPPPLKPANTGSFGIAPPPMGMNSMASLRAQTQNQQQQQQQQQQNQQQTNWGSGSDSLI
jgi:SCY1-like protein 2